MNVPQPPFNTTVDLLLYLILQKLKNNLQGMSIPAIPFHTATERLLYEILQKISSGNNIQTAYNNTLYVSSSYGNDWSAQKNNILQPYYTIGAAIENFMPGDLIHVMEGVYDEGNINGVLNYWFDYGAVVSFAGGWGEAIFQPMYGSCTVRGYGNFICTGDANAIFPGEWFGSNFDLECESIETYGNGVGCMIYQNNNFDQTLNTPIRIKARRIYSQNCSPVMFLYEANAIVEAEEIVCDSTYYPCFYNSGSSVGLVKNAKIVSNNTMPIQIDGYDGTLTLDNVTIYANNVYAYAGLWISNQLLNLYLKNTEFICVNTSTPCLRTNSIVNIYLDDNTRSNTDTARNPGLFVYQNKDRKIHLPEIFTEVDITGQTTLDLGNLQNQTYIRVVSSNAAETLHSITNAPQHHSFVIIPQNNLILTITSANANLAGWSDIVTDRSSIILQGLNGDWIEFYSGFSSQGSQLINFKNYITGQG